MGAADLLRGDLEAADPGSFVLHAWRGDLGEYPPLYPATVAAGWAVTGGGQPGRLAVRLLNAGALILAAGAASALARRTAERALAAWAALGAFCATLLLPLANGLARHFMPEGMLVAATAALLLAAARAVERPSAARLLALGGILGAGMLVKQTFALGAAPVLVWVLLQLRGRALLSLVVAGLAAGPWYAGHLLAQTGYLGGSAAARVGQPLLAHLAYYPAVAIWEGLGPVLALGLALAILTLRRAPTSAPTRLACAGLLGGLALLTAVPKKYPRLLAPLTPAVAVLLGAAVARSSRPGLVLLAGGGLGAAWLGFASLYTLEEPSFIRDFDGSCPQRWLRAPQPDDLGLPEVAALAAMAGPGEILVIDPPEIPCAVATTPPWDAHLPPYLERAGLDREVRSVRSGAEMPAAALIVDWNGGPGQRVEVPALGRSFWLRLPRTDAPARGSL